MTRRCSNCGTLNNTFVNPNTCWQCGRPWPERPRIHRQASKSPGEMVKDLEAKILAEYPDLAAEDIQVEYDEEAGVAEASYLRAKDGTPAGGFGGAE